VKLSELLAGSGLEVPRGLSDAEVSSVTNDSRKVRPGSLFVAIEGYREDGHSYVDSALAAGAVAAVVSKPVEGASGRTIVCMPGDGRRLLGMLSARIEGSPWEKLRTVGITGTNGKTSTAHMTAWILDRLGLSCGILGTVGHRVGGVHLDAKETTPDSAEIASLMRRMVDAGDAACAMEVSSHALTLSRVDEVRFDVAMFTNITQDHLDFHGTMHEYLAAKERIFSLVKPDGHILVGTYAPGSPVPDRALTFGTSEDDSFSIRGVESGPLGSAFTLVRDGETHRVSLAVPGRVNIFNAAGAAAACSLLGLDLGDCLDSLSGFRGVPGRLEVVDEGQAFLVAVDYAHTPDAVERVLLQAREMATGRVIAVIGAGGDRDRTKRPLMGAIASELSDVVIVTSDNPRGENPISIIDEIVAGVDGPAEVEVQPDRRAAITRAVGRASDGDVVIIAGKGHEDYQIIGGVRHHFDDREEARLALRARRDLEAEG